MSDASFHTQKFTQEYYEYSVKTVNDIKTEEMASSNQIVETQKMLVNNRQKISPEPEEDSIMSPTPDCKKDISGAYSLYHQKKIQEENDRIARLLKPYSSFLVKYPYVVIILVLLVVIISAALGFVDSLGAQPLPNFSKPVKGFEPRGSTISNRKTTYKNLEEAIKKGELLHNVSQPVLSRKRRELNSFNIDQDLSYHQDECTLVYKHIDGNNLFDHMKSICQLHQKKIVNFPGYHEIMIPGETHHIPNYIAFLNDKSNCENINETHTQSFVTLLKTCVVYYVNGQLKACISDKSGLACNQIKDTSCTSHHRVSEPQSMARLLYNVFFYLTETSFQEDVTQLKLTNSFDIIFNWQRSAQVFSKPLYETTLKDSKAELNGVQIVAYNLYNLKFYLFESEIVLQSLLIVTAIVLVIIFIWFYSGSLFIGLSTIACIIFALIISYFVYGRIFQMSFFPFLNMATLIFIVGIGADDAFVFTGIWEEAKQVYVIKNNIDHIDYLIKWTTHSLRHALLAMLVTSLTTASAFYANISSQVTSVKCFGLFAGTAIIVNYLLMVTLFPVIVILHDLYFSRCMHFLCPNICSKRPDIFEEGHETMEINTNALEQTNSNASNMKENKHISLYEKLQLLVDLISSQLFKVYLQVAVLKLRYFWIALFSALGIGGCVVTFFTPGMKPPSTSEFQMFSSDSTLEKFGLEYKQKFAFGAGGAFNLPIFIVIGAKPSDNGNKFDPDDTGSLEYYSKTLDIASNQLWLQRFCENLKQASFYERSSICENILKMFQSIQGSCLPGQTLCCKKIIPLPANEFQSCFQQALNSFPKSTDIYGPLFDHNSNLKTFTIDLQSKFYWTMDFDYNKDLFNEAENWFDNQFSNATDSFKGYWYTYQDFYDLQTSLFSGTKQSLGIAIAVSFLVILLTTWNILLSLYSILSITFIIAVTVGSLILSGWRLNIMESVVFSVAAGLSADFTLHYSVAYRTSLIKDNRVERVKSSLIHIGPAVLMGAFTTFLAGLVMVPSTILAYIQMAQFLMLVMFISWVYGTFFFLSICAVIGPVGSVGQLSWSQVKSVRHSIHKGQRHLEMEPVQWNSNPGGVYYGPTEQE